MHWSFLIIQFLTSNCPPTSINPFWFSYWRTFFLELYVAPLPSRRTSFKFPVSFPTDKHTYPHPYDLIIFYLQTLYLDPLSYRMTSWLAWYTRFTGLWVGAGDINGDLSSTGSFVKWPLQPDLNQIWNRNFIQASYVTGKGPMTWTTFYCFFRHISMELN